MDLKKIPEHSFVLNFHFAPNEYFQDSVLTKEYFIKYSPEYTVGFTFDRSKIHKCLGCIIHWKNGNNITMKIIKTKGINKGM